MGSYGRQRCWCVRDLHTVTLRVVSLCQVLACVPDLLTLVGVDSGQPVSTEEVRYGLRVALLALPAPPELTTARALQVVGPHAFGYPPEEVTYTPVATYVHHSPIPTPSDG